MRLKHIAHAAHREGRGFLLKCLMRQLSGGPAGMGKSRGRSGGRASDTAVWSSSWYSDARAFASYCLALCASMAWMLVLAPSWEIRSSVLSLHIGNAPQSLPGVDCEPSTDAPSSPRLMPPGSEYSPTPAQGFALFHSWHCPLACLWIVRFRGPTSDAIRWPSFRNINHDNRTVRYHPMRSEN